MINSKRVNHLWSTDLDRQVEDACAANRARKAAAKRDRDALAKLHRLMIEAHLSEDETSSMAGDRVAADLKATEGIGVGTSKPVLRVGIDPHAKCLGRRRPRSRRRLATRCFPPPGSRRSARPEFE